MPLTEEQTQRIQEEREKRRVEKEGKKLRKEEEQKIQEEEERLRLEEQEKQHTLELERQQQLLDDVPECFRMHKSMKANSVDDVEPSMSTAAIPLTRDDDLLDVFESFLEKFIIFEIYKKNFIKIG